MRYLKSIVFALMLLVLAIAPGVGAQETTIEPTPAVEELSPDQFWEEFQTALQANDAVRIHQLITANPTTAEQVQQRLTEKGEGTGEKAEQDRTLAESLEKFRSGDFSFMLDRLNKEAEQAYYAADYVTALGKLQAGLKQARALNDKQYISTFLNNIGWVCRDLGQYQRALKSYEQALAIFREIGDRRGEGVVLGNISNVYGALGQYQRALKSYEQALAIFREIGDRHREATALTSIGNVYEVLGQYLQALEYHEQSLAIARKIGDRRGEGNALNNTGIVYDNLGQYQRALEYYEQALAIDRELGDRREEGMSLTNIGVVYAELGQYQRALTAVDQALAIHRELEDRQSEGITVDNLGGVHQALGQYQRALEFFKQALVIHREIGDRRGEGRALGNIGRVYDDLGQYQRALDYYEQALKIARELGHRREEGAVLGNLGIVYENLGQDQQALAYYKQALAIHREIGDLGGEGNALNNIGLVHKDLRQYEQALGFYEQALTIAREIGDRQGEGDVLNNIGIVYENLGQDQQALAYYKQALAIYRKLGGRRGEGGALTNLGGVYWNLGQYQEALSTLQNSIGIHTEIGNTEFLWRAQRDLATVKARLNQPESAIIHYEQALDTIEQLRAGLREKEHKLSFMQDKLFVYDELIDLLQSLHKEHPDKGYDRKALEIFERKQGRVFLEEMGQSGARLFAGIPEALLQHELDLELQFEQTRKQLGDERSKLITEQNKDLIQNLEERENTLLSDQAALQEQIKTEYPDYYALRYPKPVALADLQQKVLQPGELLLVYGVMQDKTCLWVIGPEEFGLHVLDIGEEVLAEKVAAFRGILDYEWRTGRGLFVIPSQAEQQQEAIEQPRVPFAQVSHALYNLLIPDAVRPFVKSHQTLTIVPTGPLYGLPFEALVTENPPLAPPKRGRTPPYAPLKGGIVHYLVEEIPISYLSSASLLKTLREAKARRKATALYPLLAFAHPAYQPTPGPSQEGTPSLNPLRQAQDRLSHQGRGTESSSDVNSPSLVEAASSLNSSPLVGEGGGGKETLSFQELRRQSYRNFCGGDFPELPETAAEARAIAKLLNAPDESDPLQLRAKASRANVYAFNDNDRLDKYDYLVFAMHGVLPGEMDQIAQPALVLSDDFLTMADVFSLQLNAKLVSLSACNTGRGTQVKGEGVMGLTRAFMYAGTPAVAVTLWSVETLSAKDLDIGFFRHLNDGLPPAQALQAIKKQMLRGEVGKRYQHPYYWAPFVLFGDGQ